MFIEFLVKHWGYLALLIPTIILIFESVVIVGGNEIALIERRWFGRKMPQGRVVALGNEVGIQAQTLGPGLHFLIPFIYKASKSVFTEILENEIGLIEAVDGSSIPAGRIFAAVVQGHNSFQDGEAFIKNGGQKGPQIEILPPGKYRINPYLFKLTKGSVTEIKDFEIGIGESVDGVALPECRMLARAAKGPPSAHKGDAFTNSGGQKGPQIEFIPPGNY